MYEKLKQGRRLLIASLPANDEDLARAALDAGVDALKLHLNVGHRASGNRFGGFDEERGRLEKIAALAAGRVELGIMPGVLEQYAAVKELRRLAEMGFSFFDMYARHMPVEYLAVEELEPMAALGHESDGDYGLWKGLGVLMFEASVTDPSEYGAPLTVGDLAAYKRLCAECGLPVVVPTQKKIGPGEVGPLFDIGVSALMIGAVVAGRTAESFGKAAARFKAAVDKWNAGSEPGGGIEHPGFGVA